MKNESSKGHYILVLFLVFALLYSLFERTHMDSNKEDVGSSTSRKVSKEEMREIESSNDFYVETKERETLAKKQEKECNTDFSSMYGYSSDDETIFVVLDRDSTFAGLYVESDNIVCIGENDGEKLSLKDTRDEEIEIGYEIANDKILFSYGGDTYSLSYKDGQEILGIQARATDRFRENVLKETKTTALDSFLGDNELSSYIGQSKYWVGEWVGENCTLKIQATDDDSVLVSMESLPISLSREFTVSTNGIGSILLDSEGTEILLEETISDEGEIFLKLQTSVDGKDYVFYVTR